MTDVHGALVAQAELLDQLLTPDPPPRRRWPFYALALVLLVGAAGVAAALHYTRAPDGPPHPSAWDPRVQKYVDFVESTRHLEFQHPVYVDFLPDAEFEKKVTSDASELTDEDRKEIDQATGLLRALGLVEGDVDLFDKSNELNGKGIIGFYSYDDERLRIRGTEITPAVESTIVHELTHALQDQNFDLGARFDELAKADDASSSAASEGFDALVEGDARRIEGKWRDSLSAPDRKALDTEQAKDAKGFDAASGDVPEVLKTMTSAPYELGQALLAVAVEQGGDDAVDGLFRSPPKTEEQQLDPWTLIADHQGVLTVPPPELADGEKPWDGAADGAFGSLGWLMLLSERLPLERALTAVDGWGGDSTVAYQHDGTSCVKIDYRADTPDDLGQMQTALQAWVRKLPASASVVRQGVTLLFTSCDPGKAAAKVAAGKSMDALELALSRTYLSVQLARSGAAVPVARCAADRLVRVFTAKQLTDPHLDPRAVVEATAPCRETA